MTFMLELVHLSHRFYQKRAEYSILFLARRASLCNKVCLITVFIMNLLHASDRFDSHNYSSFSCAERYVRIIQAG